MGQLLKLLGGIQKVLITEKSEAVAGAGAGSRPSGIRQCFKIDRGWQLHPTHGNWHGKNFVSIVL
jgi:hypothetical protein